MAKMRLHGKKHAGKMSHKMNTRKSKRGMRKGR
jgi:hypothetical protein